MNRNKLIKIFFFLLVACFASAQSLGKITYQITPIYLSDKIDFDINVNIRAQNNSPIIISYPNGCGNEGKLLVKSFVGENGTEINATDKERTKLVKPNNQNEIFLKYTISFDPASLKAIYDPVVTPDYFSLMGCQWALGIGDRSKNEKRDYTISVTESNDWNVVFSSTENPQKIEINDADWWTINGFEARISGSKKVKKVFIKDKPLYMYINGKFNISDEKIYETIEKIVTAQRKWLDDFTQPFYSVVVNERAGTVSGMSLENQFVCFMKPDATMYDMKNIMAHEMFHAWIPHKIKYTLADGDWYIRQEWFTEGFTEYFAGRAMYENGIFSKTEYLRFINNNIKSLAENPYKNITFAELDKVERNGKTNNTYKRTSYYRGLMMAMKWNEEIKKNNKGKDMADFVKYLYNIAKKNNGTVGTEADFLKLATSFGVKNAKKDFENYIIKGKDIKLLNTDLGEEFTAKKKKIEYWEFSENEEM